MVFKLFLFYIFLGLFKTSNSYVTDLKFLRYLSKSSTELVRLLSYSFEFLSSKLQQVILLFFLLFLFFLVLSDVLHTL